jgi:4-amino-4-deoxy-L-arabinose transferase-like glycosyltransferase
VRRLSRLQLGLLLAILLVAGALRCHGLGAESLWLDELHSLEASTGRSRTAWVPPTGVVVDPPARLTALEGAPPWWSVWGAMQEYTHPPLYFMALRLWRELFGTGDAAARGLSVAAGLVALLLLFDTARTLHGSVPALWACLLMALASPQILYSREARGYTLLLALALGASAALVRIERSGTSMGRLLALGLCAAGCLFTHFHSLGALGAVGLYALLRLRGRARQRSVLVLLASGLLFAAAWCPVMWFQHGRLEGFWLQEPALGHLGRTLNRLASLPLQLLVATIPEPSPTAPWSALAYLLPWLALRRRSDLLLWCLWLVVPVGLLAGLDLSLKFGQLSHIRYALIAGPAVYALAAALLVHRRARHALPGAAALVCLLALPGVYREVKMPWRDIGGTLQLAARPGEVLILASGEDRAAFRHALLHYSHSPARPLLLLGDRLYARARRRLEVAGTAWLVSDGTMQVDRRLPGAAVADELKWPREVFLRRLSFPGTPSF